jgi:hypothetical protein
MVGGLLNLAVIGKKDYILTGNPSKTFFKATYAKYTNFGLQKFRIANEGRKKLQLCENSTFRFKIPRYADLLMDTYFVLTLPNIWSPVFAMRESVGDNKKVWNDVSNCQPYEFKWIENLGSSLIHRVRYFLDDNMIHEFTGQYLYSMVQRDFSNEKKDLFNKMTGHVPELNDPANYSNRNGNYPNASYFGQSDISWSTGIEPSIRSKQLYIPLNIWSTLSSKMALPLVSMQYSQLYIEVECRPIEDLFVLRDINYFINWITDPSFSDISYNNSRAFPAPYVHPEQNFQHNKFYYFLKEPPPDSFAIRANGAANSVEYSHYKPFQTDWFADIHLMATYAFLSDGEVRKFANECQSYLIREVHEQTIYDLIGPYKRVIDSLGLVVSWMWFFQRSDVRERNQWSNYSNWAYDNVVPVPPTLGTRWDFWKLLAEFDPALYAVECARYSAPDVSWIEIGIPALVNPGICHGLVPYPEPCPAVCPHIDYTNLLYNTGQLHIENTKDIMIRWGLYLDGMVRETTMDAGVTNYIEKYVRTAGGAKSGLYCYNFCLNTDPFQFQPSGAINLSKFNRVEWEFETIEPVDASSVSVSVTCDVCGNFIPGDADLPIPRPAGYEPAPISADKGYWKTYKYYYNLHIMEERYNILLCDNGVGNLVFAR